MIGIIVQARTSSTRFPDKILSELFNGLSVIEYLINNLLKVTKCQNLIVATTDNVKDDRLVNILNGLSVSYYRGSENDVRQRYIETAEAFGIDTIIRIPSDNPFSIPALIDELITEWNTNSFDYISTTLTDSFPIGTHIEIFKLESLKKTKEICNDQLSVEHVTPCIYNNESIFKLHGYIGRKEWSKYRLTIDYIEDLQFAKKLAERIGQKVLNLNDIISLIDTEPSIFELNSMYNKKAYVEL